MKSVIPNSALWWGGLRFQLPSCFVPQHEGMASSRKALARAGRVPTRSLRELKSRPQVGRGLRRLGGARGSRRFGRCGPGTTKLLRSRARRPSTGDAKAELVAAPLSSFRLQRARLVRVVHASRRHDGAVRRRASCRGTFSVSNSGFRVSAKKSEMAMVLGSLTSDSTMALNSAFAIGYLPSRTWLRPPLAGG